MKTKEYSINITSNNILVRDLFLGEENKELHNKTWVLSKGQRMYSWNKEQINQLLEDIQYVKKNNIDNYLLQSITISESEKEVRVLDGQQRLTTLYLIKLAIVIIKYREYSKEYSKFDNKRYDYIAENNIDLRERLETKYNLLEEYYDFLKKQDIPKFQNSKDNFSEEYKDFCELVNSTKENTDERAIKKRQQRVDEYFIEFNKYFKEYVNKNKIKLNIFLIDHKDSIYKLFNSEIYEFVSKISSTFGDDELYKKTIKTITKCDIKEIDFDYRNSNKYTYNIFENLKIILNKLKNEIESNEDYLEEFENTLNNHLSLNLTNLGKVDDQQEIKNFVNINSRGLKLDFSDQFKSWYLSKVLEQIDNKESKSLIFMNIDNFFDKLYKKFDIVKNGEDINLINHSLVHTINFYGHFTTYLKKKYNLESEKEEDTVNDIAEFFTLSTKEINTAWYSFQYMISISENWWIKKLENNKYHSENIKSKPSKINIYQKLITEIKECKENEYPLFLKFWEKIIKGLNRYNEKIDSDDKNWFTTSHPSRMLPYISLVLAQSDSDGISEKIIKDSITSINAISVILTLKGSWTNDMSKMQFIVNKVWDQYDRYNIIWMNDNCVITNQNDDQVKGYITNNSKIEDIELFLNKEVVAFFIEKAKEQICYSWHTTINAYESKYKYGKSSITNLNYQRFLYVLGNFSDETLIKNKFNVHHQIPQVLFKETANDQFKLNENYIAEYFSNESVIKNLIEHNSNPLIFTQFVEESWNKSWKHNNKLNRPTNKEDIKVNIEYYFGEEMYFSTQNEKPDKFEYKIKIPLKENSIIYDFKKIYEEIEKVIYKNSNINNLKSENIDIHIRNIKNYKINKYLELRNNLKNNWKKNN